MWYPLDVSFYLPITVRYYEADAQGVVFNMWYLGWFDEAMTAFLAARGLPYQRMLDAGFDVHLVHSELDWRSPVHWGDDVAVTVRTERLGRTSFTLAFAALRDGQPAVTASTVYVVIATDGSGKRELPELLTTALEDR